MIIITQAHSHGGLSEAVTPKFVFSQKICFRHTIKTQILPAKNVWMSTCCHIGHKFTIGRIGMQQSTAGVNETENA